MSAGEAAGQRERPYDFRWGTPEQVKDWFGLGAAALKAAWRRGWVRARQGNWEDDGKRTQTVYCFEDLHAYMERAAHRVSAAYAERWWTDESVAALEERLPDGPYAGARRAEAARARVRKDGFAPLPRRV